MASWSIPHFLKSAYLDLFYRISSIFWEYLFLRIWGLKICYFVSTSFYGISLFCYFYFICLCWSFFLYTYFIAYIKLIVLGYNAFKQATVSKQLLQSLIICPIRAIWSNLRSDYDEAINCVVIYCLHSLLLLFCTVSKKLLSPLQICYYSLLVSMLLSLYLFYYGASVYI